MSRPETCSHRSCDKPASTECRYCEKSFCSQHIRAVEPYIGDPFAETLAARIARMEEGKSHPCRSYVEFREQDDPKQTRKYLNTLDAISGRRHAEPIEVHSHSKGQEYVKTKSQSERQVTCSHDDCGYSGKTHSCNFCHKQFCKYHIKTRNHACPVHAALQQKKEHRVHSQQEKRDVREIALENIRKSHGQHENVIASPKKQRSRKVIALIVVAVIILIFVSLLIAWRVNRITYKEAIVSSSEETLTHSDQVPTPLDFGLYIANRDAYLNKEITITGKLKHQIQGTTQSGIHIESIIDDKGNEIKLSKLTSEQKKLFTQNGITRDAYSVNGVMRKTLAVTNLDVVSITPAEIIYQTVLRNTTQNKTNTSVLERSQTFKEWLFSSLDCENNTKNGACSQEQPYYCQLGRLTSNPEKCGCPTDQREYDGACIEIVSCSDGTLAPECSASKPNQCIDGKLLSKASVCGCPDGYRRNEDYCTKIMLCSDGTEYGNCANNKPTYCDNGALVQNAQKCGCSWGDFESDGKCVDRITATELEIFRFTNEQRVENGLRPLKWNAALADIARDHSEDMVARNFFDHENPDGENPTARAKRHGFNVHKQLGGGWYSDGIAENINIMPSGNVEGVGYVSDTPKDIAYYSVDGWMHSPGHRANILDDGYTEIGVGVAKGSQGYYGTQNFY